MKWAMLAFVFMACLVATPAAADDAKKQALAVLKEGNALFDRHAYHEALSKYQAAYALYPSIKLHLNIGTTLKQLHRYAEALDHYERYMAAPKAEPKRKDELEPLLEKLRAKVARVRIEVSELGASVTVDGKPIEMKQRTAELRLDPGEHTVLVELDGFQQLSSTLTLRAGQQRSLDLRLKPLDEPAGEPVSSFGAQRIAALVVGGVGVAGLAVGSGLGLSAISTQEDALATCRNRQPTLCTAESLDLNESAKTQATISTVSFAVGGGALVAGVVLFFTAPSASTEGTEAASWLQSLQVAPLLSPELVGFSLCGAL